LILYGFLRIIYCQKISAINELKFELKSEFNFIVVMEDNCDSKDLPPYLDKCRHLQPNRVDRTDWLNYFKEASTVVECTDHVFCSTKYPSIDSNILHFCAVRVELSEDNDVMLLPVTYLNMVSLLQCPFIAKMSISHTFTS